MRLSHVLVAAGIVCAGVVAGAGQVAPPVQSAAQASTQTPIFKSNVLIARLDIEAVDQQGRPVTDLKQSDFSVFENGVRQDIRTFSREEMKPEPVSATVTPTLVRGLPPDPLAPRTRRVFLLVFGSGRGIGQGWGNVNGPAKAFDGAMSFIRERLLPQDMVSVMALNRATDFTADHELVAQVVDRLKQKHVTLQAEVGQYFERTFVRGHITEDIPASIQADIDAAFEPPGTTNHHMRSALNLLMGTDAFRKIDDVSWQRPWNKMVVDSDLLKVYAGIEYLRNLDGEKHLVCLRGGDSQLGTLPSWIMGSPQNDAGLAARANDARVVLDTIYTSGLRPLPRAARGMPATLGSLDSVTSAEDISDLTGGQFTGVNFADVALAQIDEATRFGYVIGYAPSNPTLDSTYRNVTVKVNRPGVTTRFRHGYTARADVAPLDVREILTSSRLKAAEATDVDEHDITLQATASAVPGAGSPGVRVDLIIDASRLSLTQSGDRRVGTIDLDIFCGDAKQKLIGSLKQKMQMSLDEAHYQRAMKDGIPYSVTVPTTAAPARVRVLVYDYGSDLLGSANVSVK